MNLRHRDQALEQSIPDVPLHLFETIYRRSKIRRHARRALLLSCMTALTVTSFIAFSVFHTPSHQTALSAEIEEDLHEANEFLNGTLSEPELSTIVLADNASE